MRNMSYQTQRRCCTSPTQENDVEQLKKNELMKDYKYRPRDLKSHFRVSKSRSLESLPTLVTNKIDIDVN